MTTSQISLAGLPKALRIDSGAPVRSLRRNFQWTIVGNVVYACTQWGILVLLAHLGDAVVVGRFSLGLAITAPIMLFAGLSLRAVQATDARREFLFADYAGLRLLMVAIALSAIVSIALYEYSGETAAIIMLFGVSKSIESLSDLFYGFWQQHERLDLIAKSLVLRGLLAIILGAAAYIATHATWAAVLGIGVAWALVFIAFDLKHAIILARQTSQSLMPCVFPDHMKKLAKLALPLGLVAMLVSLNANVPRYAINHFQSVREVGTFSALSYVHMAGTMVVVALSQAASPRLAMYASRNQSREYRKLFSQMLLVGLVLASFVVSAATLFGRQVLLVLYGSEYASSEQLFVWLSAAAGITFVASFVGTGLTAARHFRIQFPLFLSITAINVALCFSWVRSDGLMGAAKALTVVAAIQLIATMVALAWLEGRKLAATS